MLMASQVAAGEGNGLRLRVYGEKGSIDWRQEDPNRLRVKWLDGPEETRHAAGGYLSEDARAVARLPGGHPEGYLEAFAVLYREFADGLTCVERGKSASAARHAAGDRGWGARDEVYRACDRKQQEQELDWVLTEQTVVQR